MLRSATLTLTGALLIGLMAVLGATLGHLISGGGPTASNAASTPLCAALCNGPAHGTNTPQAPNNTLGGNTTLTGSIH